MENWLNRFELSPKDAPNDGILFADHSPKGRSGHMGHALVEYGKGKLLAFYPNCSAIDPRYKGHSGDGWMEYRRSIDGGRTWSEPIVEPHSKALHEAQCGRTMMCEKAVCTEDGTIVLFYLTCDMRTNGHIWEPYFEPYYAFSTDGGETWSELHLFVHEAGRIYDVLYRDGVMYALFYANAELPGVAHERDHDYRLYVSEDGGKKWELRSVLPFQSTMHCYYGTMEFMPDGRLIAYIYDEKDEYNLKYLVSEDGGRTWGVNRRAFFEKKIRNPQLVYFDGTWFMHGRSGSFGKDRGHFVLYSSQDGVNWDAGQYLRMATAGAGAYSNNLVVHLPEGENRLMIQTSHAYEGNKTNTIMWWIDHRK